MSTIKVYTIWTIHILKIIPIDFVCETNINVIKQIVQEEYKNFIERNESFKISLKRRNHDSIERNTFIDTVAKNIDNKVDLENPNVICLRQIRKDTE